MPSERLFSLYHQVDETPLEAALFAIELRDNGQVAYAQLQYLQSYTAHPEAIPFLPEMPLEPQPFDYSCMGQGVPGFIDELLPDAWGRRLIAHTLAGQGLRHNPTVVDLLSVSTGSLIGCFACVPYGAPPPVASDGLRLVDAGPAIHSARRVDRNEATDSDFERLALAGASSPKGARPKLLVHDDGHYWLAKLARGVDTYDVVLAEHTALTIARDAGLEAPATQIVDLEGERALLVERFDRRSDDRRHHLISANALLKDPRSQEDRLHAAYDDLARLIRRYSRAPAKDLRQLLGQALLNAALNNTDDHLRNFSFLADHEGLRLSPAYDIVPTATLGAYHQLNWGYSPNLPNLDAAESAARHLGLPAREGSALADALKAAIRKHTPALRKAGALPFSQPA